MAERRRLTAAWRYARDYGAILLQLAEGSGDDDFVGAAADVVFGGELCLPADDETTPSLVACISGIHRRRNGAGPLTQALCRRSEEQLLQLLKVTKEARARRERLGREISVGSKFKRKELRDAA